MKPLIIYHAGCLDGMTAALVTAKALYNDKTFKQDGLGRNEILLQDGIAIEPVAFIAAKYGDPVPDLTDREVYIVDFSYPPEALIPVSVYAKSITIIDHHQTAIDKWTSFIYSKYNIKTVFDINYSGAGLAWNYFKYSKQLSDTEQPRWVTLAQDHDLGKHEYADTKPFVAALYADGCIQEGNIYEFDYLVTKHPNRLIQDGIILLTGRDKAIKEILKNNTKEITFEGHNVLIANVPYQYATDAGYILAKDRAFSITYDDQHSLGIRKYSLRSSRGTGVDVAKIAERYHGGGHPTAAGFTVPLYLRELRIFTK